MCGHDCHGDGTTDQNRVFAALATCWQTMEDMLTPGCFAILNVR
jgi:hypothetical protein